jgi:hypothetical protein
MAKRSSGHHAPFGRRVAPYLITLGDDSGWDWEPTPGSKVGSERRKRPDGTWAYRYPKGTKGKKAAGKRGHLPVGSSTERATEDLSRFTSASPAEKKKVVGEYQQAFKAMAASGEPQARHATMVALGIGQWDGVDVEAAVTPKKVREFLTRMAEESRGAGWQQNKNRAVVFEHLHKHLPTPTSKKPGKKPALSPQARKHGEPGATRKGQATSPATVVPAGENTAGTPEWSKNTDSVKQAEFKVDGVEFTLLLERPYDGSPWGIHFWRQTGGSFRQKAMENRTAGARVYGVIKRLVEKFIDESNPATLEFAADEKEPSRVRFYDAIAKRVGESGQYSVNRTVKDGDVVYTLTRTWINWSGRLVGMRGRP